jgi:drug resistance transporter, Bcr/CflA subfamily
MTLARRVRYIIVLGALVALGPFTVDLYLPAFPVLAEDLRASELAVQFTLTATMLGFGLGQLVIGPWSDTVGRRLPLIVATTVHIVASIGVAMAPDIAWVMACRILQGVGGAGGAVVAMATVRDLFDGQPLVRMLSRLALVTGLAPIVAPVVGSQLMAWLDWRGLFGVLAGYGAVILVLAWLLIAETLPRERRHPRGLRATGHRYATVLRDRTFIGVALIAGLSFAGNFAYLAASPFVFQRVHGLDVQQFGLVFALNSLGLAIGSQTASRLMRRIAPPKILAVSLPTLVLAGLGVALSAVLDWGLAPLVVSTFVYLFCCGIGFPTVNVTALSPHGSEAGTAAALLGTINVMVATVITPIVGLFGTESAVPMGLGMAAPVVVAIALLWIVVRPLRSKVVGHEESAPAEVH